MVLESSFESTFLKDQLFKFKFELNNFQRFKYFKSSSGTECTLLRSQVAATKNRNWKESEMVDRV